MPADTLAGPGPDRDTRPGGPATVTAVAYVCTTADDQGAQALFSAWCRQRADDIGWTITETVADTDDRLPLAERPGWQHVTQLLTAGDVDAVITVQRRMVAPDQRAWERLTELVQGLGTILVTTTSTPATPAGRQPGGAS